MPTARANHISQRFPRLRANALGRSAAVLTVAVMSVATARSAETTYSRREADSFVRKVIAINDNSTKPNARRAPLLTPLSERELNAYLQIHAGDQIPAGVVEPSIGILGDGRLSGRALVDLDAVRQKQSSGGWFDPMSYLSGRLPITATGVLQTSKGVGKFTLETATISGVTVPKSVLQQILSYYSRTPDNADGVSLEDPFELPAEIQEIRVGKGEAVVVQ